MDVDVDNPPGGQSDYQGSTYYFCAPGCKVAFDGEPEKYLTGQPAGQSAESAPPKVSFFARIFGKKS
jgi:YHS domain-containing protein